MSLLSKTIGLFERTMRENSSAVIGELRYSICGLWKDWYSRISFTIASPQPHCIEKMAEEKEKNNWKGR